MPRTPPGPALRDLKRSPARTEQPCPPTQARGLIMSRPHHIRSPPLLIFGSASMPARATSELISPHVAGQGGGVDEMDTVWVAAVPAGEAAGIADEPHPAVGEIQGLGSMA